MDLDLARQCLATFGYELRERHNEWAECLLLGHGEVWHGFGADADQALTRALAQCFPSVGARQSLVMALVALGEAGARDPAVPAEEVDDSPSLAEDPAFEVKPTEAGSAEVAVLPAVDLASPEGDQGPEGVQPRAVGTVTPGGEQQAIAELKDLEARADAQRLHLALVSPRRQRLVLLGWLAEARAQQEAYPRNLEIAAAVATLVKKLRSLSESWWPGMISAFQRDAHPLSTRYKDLRGFTESLPASWAEVAEIANEALAEVEQEDASAHMDDDGWADRGQVFPAPSDPLSLLAEIVAEVEDAGGPLGSRQPKDGKVPDRADLVRWGQHARWLRGSPPNAELWAALAGRLRFWAQQFPRDPEIAQLLDPSFRPPQSWAKLIRTEGQERREMQDLEGVLAVMPPPNSADSMLTEWLERALPLTSNHQNAIVAACQPLHARIVGVDDGRFASSDKRIRRRLQKLKAAISEGEVEQAVAGGSVASTVPWAANIDAEPIAVPTELLAATHGKRVLFVSNRTDEELWDRLDSMLDLAALDWAQASPRRIASAVGAISAGSYDLVLAATGFMGHKDDALLSRACRGVGVPFIRADKGRPGAVIRALMRELPAAL